MLVRWMFPEKTRIARGMIVGKDYLFIDLSVREADHLVAGLRAGTTVHRLAVSGDPLSEIAAVLTGRAGVRRISILAHGAPGTVELSGRRIDAAALRAAPNSLSRIRSTLAPGAELALISCEAGAGRAGGELVDALEAALGATVWASSLPLGGDAGWSGLPVAGAFFSAEALHAYPERLAVTGTPSTGNDTLTSDGAADNIDALGGNDIVYGNGGNDTLSGNGGNDTLYGGTGNDSLRAGTGSDVLFGGDGNDTLHSLFDSGADTFYGGDGDDFTQSFVSNAGAVFYGGDGNDTFHPLGGAGTGTSTGITIYGDAGDDFISSDDGADTIYGGTGNDTIYGDDAGGKALNLIYGDDGNDVLYSGAFPVDGDGGTGSTVYGGSGDDTFYACSDRDILVGGSGADVFAGQFNVTNLNGDTIYGLEVGDAIFAKSTDLSSLNGSIVGSTISLGGSNAVNIANASGSLQISVSFDGTHSTLTFSLAPPSSATSLSVRDQSAGDGTVTNQTLTNNTGATASGLLIGGTGSGNTITVTLPAGLSVTNAGTATAVSGSTAGTTLTSQLRGSGASTANQTFLDTHGQGYVNGLGGTPLDIRTLTFSGSDGTQQTVQVTGTANGGGEALIIDSSGLMPGSTLQLDHIDFAAVLGNATVIGGAGTNYVVGDDAAQFVSLGTGNDTIAGGGGSDTLNSGYGEDLIYGNQGADSMLGGGGRDTLFGGQDGDVLLGGNDNDLLYGNKGADTISGGGNDDVLFGGQDNDILYGNAGNDSLFGNLGADTLCGGQGNDTLAGGDGADRIEGNRGDDVLSGGAGADTFVFSFGDGNETVTDFAAGTDTLALQNGLGVSGGAESGGNTLVTFSDGGTVTVIGVSKTDLAAATGWDLG